MTTPVFKILLVSVHALLVFKNVGVQPISFLIHALLTGTSAGFNYLVPSELYTGWQLYIQYNKSRSATQQSQMVVVNQDQSGFPTSNRIPDVNSQRIFGMCVWVICYRVLKIELFSRIGFSEEAHISHLLSINLSMTILFFLLLCWSSGLSCLLCNHLNRHRVTSQLSISC